MMQKGNCMYTLAVAKATKAYSWFQLGTNASDYNQNASWNVDKLMNWWTLPNSPSPSNTSKNHIIEVELAASERKA